jgi:acyl carrier protein
MDHSRRTRITGIVERLLARRARPLQIAAETNLSDAGLTSLDLVNLMLAVEDTFGIEIPQRRMTPTNFRSVAAIDALVSDIAA